MAESRQRPDVPLYNEDDRAHRRELATRINASLAKDGSINMVGPLPLAEIATADLPTASLWEGSIVYDATTNEVKQSDGSVWAALGGGGGGGAGRINTDINTATPPTTEAVTGNFEIYDLADDDELATFGYNASNELQIINNMRPATTTTTAMSFQIVGGTDNTLITDKMVLNSNEFLVRQRTATATYDLLKKDTDELILYGANSATSTPGVNRVSFTSRTGGLEGYVGYSGSSEFQVETRVDDVVMILAGRESAARRTYFTGQANGTAGVKLYWPRGSDVVLETLGSGTTAYGVNINEALYFDGRAAANTDLTAKGQVYVSTADNGLYYKYTGENAVRLDIATQTKHKTADESVTSSSALQDDDHLVDFDILAATYYKIEGCLRVQGPTAGNINFGFTCTQTPVNFFTQFLAVNTGAGRVGDAIDAIGGTAFIGLSATTDHVITITGTIEGHATLDGLLDLQWAQGTSDATATFVKDGSWITLTKM